MRKVAYMAVAEKVINQVKRGAFLTVKADNALNTMTIGWATIGLVWHKPVFMVAVRDSRHTFGIIEKAADFTVTVPSVYMREELMYCGTKSGRDVDKFKECGLGIEEAQQVISPIIHTPGLHFECRIVFKAPMDPEYLTEDYESLYPEGDYHTLYFGEIVECYETD